MTDSSVTEVIRPCLECGVAIPRRRGNPKFCSRKCQQKKNNRDYYQSHRGTRLSGTRSESGSLIERLEGLRRRAQVTERGCWIFPLAPDEGGYGRFRHSGRALRVHRVAYEVWVGSIPAGLEIHHVCATTLCFNPEHLEATTGSRNRTEARLRNQLRPSDRDIMVSGWLEAKKMADRVAELEAELARTHRAA